MDGGSAEGTVRRGDYRNYFKVHMDQINGEGGGGGGSWVQLGWGGGMGRKFIQLYLNNNKSLKNIFNTIKLYLLPKLICKINAITI